MSALVDVLDTTEHGDHMKCGKRYDGTMMIYEESSHSGGLDVIGSILAHVQRWKAEIYLEMSIVRTGATAI